MHSTVCLVNFLVVTITIVASVAVTVAIMLLVRRRAPNGSYFHVSDRAAGVFQTLATAFSVLLAFVIFLAFSSYDSAKSAAEAEAVAASELFGTAQFMPPATVSEFEGDLICYGRAVIHDEWPLMGQGKFSRAVVVWELAMFTTLQRVDPKTASQQEAFAKWLDENTALDNGRRTRLHEAQPVIPVPLWFVLITFAAVVVGYMFFFADSGERAIVQGLLVGSVTALIVTSLLVISFLDHPYTNGSGSLQPTAMTQEVANMVAIGHLLGKNLTIPCDSQGHPL